MLKSQHSFSANHALGIQVKVPFKKINLIDYHFVLASAFIVASSQSILRIWGFSVACTGHVFHKLSSKDWLWEEIVVLNI